MRHTQLIWLVGFLLFSLINLNRLAVLIESKCEESNWERDYVVGNVYPTVHNTKLAKTSYSSYRDENSQVNYSIGLEFGKLGSLGNTVSMKLMIIFNSVPHLDCTIAERSTFDSQLSYSYNTTNSYSYNHGTNQANHLFVNVSEFALFVPPCHKTFACRKP